MKMMMKFYLEMYHPRRTRTRTLTLTRTLTRTRTLARTRTLSLRFSSAFLVLSLRRTSLQSYSWR